MLESYPHLMRNTQPMIGGVPPNVLPALGYYKHVIYPNTWGRDSEVCEVWGDKYLGRGREG